MGVLYFETKTKTNRIRKIHKNLKRTNILPGTNIDIGNKPIIQHQSNSNYVKSSTRTNTHVFGRQETLFYSINQPHSPHSHHSQYPTIVVIVMEALLSISNSKK